MIHSPKYVNFDSPLSKMHLDIEVFVLKTLAKPQRYKTEKHMIENLIHENDNDN